MKMKDAFKPDLELKELFELGDFELYLPGSPLQNYLEICKEFPSFADFDLPSMDDPYNFTVVDFVPKVLGDYLLQSFLFMNSGKSYAGAHFMSGLFKNISENEAMKIMALLD